jgi:hypothetical protein
MSLLTLSETTLYYFFLNDRTSNKEKFNTGINNWAAAIPDNEDAPASTSGKISNLNCDAAGSGSQLPALTNASSCTSTSASVLSRSIVISQNVGVNNKAEPHDKTIKVVEFGLEDDDETMGVEQKAALKSPPKGKTRVSSAVSETFPPPHLFTNLLKQKNSQGLVKDSPSKPASTRTERLSKKVSNNDLPEGTDQRLWRRCFVSTYMQFAASQPDPWDIPAGLACEKLQLIWDAIFSGIQYTVTATGAVYLLVSPFLEFIHS